jgi:hypothetical protein
MWDGREGAAGITTGWPRDTHARNSCALDSSARQASERWDEASLKSRLPAFGEVVVVVFARWMSEKPNRQG